MELKTNYQYTYFIHPFVIRDGKYANYLLKLLKDKNCNLKIFQKEKDLKLYRYFLPKMREFLFSSFSYGSNKLKKLEELPIETRVALLAKNPCNIFESPCSYQPHNSILCVGVSHKINKSRSNNMRKMTDAGRYIVVSPIVQNQGQGLQACYKVPVALYRLFGHLFRRGDDIIGIFDQNTFLMGISGLLRTRHRMSSDEMLLHLKLCHLCMDITFRTSYICNDTGRPDDGLQFL